MIHYFVASLIFQLFVDHSNKFKPPRFKHWAPSLLTRLAYKQFSFPQFSPVSIIVGIFLAPHSFQKEFFSDEKDNSAKSTKDIDVSLLANLPKGK